MPSRAVAVSIVSIAALAPAGSPVVARACTSPYTRQITSIVPPPGASGVPLDAIVIIRSEEVLGNNTPLRPGWGYPPNRLSLVEAATGVQVGGTFERRSGGPGRQAWWESVQELRFTPSERLKPNTRYMIVELDGASFTTGQADDDFAPSFGGIEQAELLEVAEPVYDRCTSETSPGMCPQELQVGWSYPLHARLWFAPLFHPIYGTVGYRYQVRQQDADEVVRDVVPADRNDAVIEFPFEYQQACYAIVAVDVDGSVLEGGSLVCLDRDQAQPAERHPDPDTGRMVCNRESGMWERSDAGPNGDDEPVAPDADGDDDAPAIDDSTPDGDPARVRRAGCALSSAAPCAPSPLATPLLLLAAAALLAWDRRRGRRLNRDAGRS